MKKRNYILIAIALIAVAAVYNNCAPSDFAFEQKENLISDGELRQRLDDINKRCDNTAHQTLNVDVSFPNPNVTCPWNTNGNLAPRDRYFQGRIEQAVPFSLPAGAILCDLDFTFANQSFRFDDMFLMTLNRKVLASSYNFSPRLQKFGTLDHYAWESIVGMEWLTQDEGIFCFHAGATQSACRWPATDTPGSISMEFSPETVRTVMAVNPTSTTHTFEMISIGDNDDLDCEHSNIQFNVRAYYVR